jgi:hypothetical protein
MGAFTRRMTDTDEAHSRMYLERLPQFAPDLADPSLPTAGVPDTGGFRGQRAAAARQLSRASVKVPGRD